MTAATHSFETLFDHAPHVRARASGVAVLARAGARIIAAPVPLETFVLLARRRDPVVHAASANVDGPARRVYVLGEETPWGAWVDHVQRVTAALQSADYDLSGFDLLVRGSIPIGGGLASGCALTVAVLRALRQAFTLPMDEDALARIAVEAEQNELAIATTHARDHATIVIDGEAHETIALPHDIELRVVSEPNDRRHLLPAPMDADALLATLREGNAERLIDLFDARPDALADRTEILAARAVAAKTTLALVKRASSSSQAA